MPTGQEQRPGLDIASSRNSAEVIYQVDVFTRALFDRHQDLIAPDIADQIVRREMVIALQEFGETVLAQGQSYFTNREPGMTIFLTGKGMEKLDEKRARHSYIEPSLTRRITDSLYQLHFPKGVYIMSAGAQFFQVGSEKWNQEGGATGPFLLDYDDVVRAEGVQGEYWQNWDYNWDGMPKPSRA